ncbi:GroES-like protein [Cerioporus squamosus]|nr:GroES-like protein [Cerioporus squamosus]
MPSHIPTTMKALVFEEIGRVAVKDHPVPKVGDDDILVKTAAVSLNPTDWMHVDLPVGIPGTVLGCDFSGTVVKVGKDVKSPKVGEHVAAFVHGCAFPDEGAFAEYVKTPAELTLTHEQAAALGCAFWTAAQVFYNPTHLALIEPPQKAAGNEWILIYGGSSGVGMSAIQLAHLSGYKVVTTASPRNFSLLKSLGADEVFDYRDPEVVSKIKAATGDSIKRALDTISVKEGDPASGGKVHVILPLPIPETTSRKDVEVSYTSLYTVLGRAYDFGPDTHYPASPEDRAQMAEFLKKLPKLMRDSAVKPLPVKSWDGGLDAIPDGLQYMREGKVSGEKIVYKL